MPFRKREGIFIFSMKNLLAVAAFMLLVRSEKTSPVPVHHAITFLFISFRNNVIAIAASKPHIDFENYQKRFPACCGAGSIVFSGTKTIDREVYHGRNFFIRCQGSVQL